jgi:hypothetical protein
MPTLPLKPHLVRKLENAGGTPTCPVGIFQSNILRQPGMLARLRDATRLEFCRRARRIPDKSPRFGPRSSAFADYERGASGDRRSPWHVAYQGGEKAVMHSWRSGVRGRRDSNEGHTKMAKKQPPPADISERDLAIDDDKANSPISPISR